MKLKKYILFFCTMLFVSHLIGQTTVKATLERDSLRVGEQIHLLLTATANSGVNVHFPLFSSGDTLCEKVEVIGYSSIDTIKGNISFKYSQKVTITSFDSGRYKLPPLKFVFQQKDTLRTDTLRLYVTNLIDLRKIDTTRRDTSLGILDIKPVLETPFTFEEFWARFQWLVWALVIGAIVTFGIWYYLKKRKLNQPIIIYQKPKEPAHVIAYRLLDELKEKKLWQQNRVKLYYIELTDILRIYIENRYNIAAMELTSHEILTHFQHNKLIDANATELLQQILLTADMVKFAKSIPLADENDLSLKNSYQFVDITKIQALSSQQTVNQNDTNKNTHV